MKIAVIVGPEEGRATMAWSINGVHCHCPPSFGLLCSASDDDDMEKVFVDSFTEVHNCFDTYL